MRFALDPFALSAEYVEAVLPLDAVKAHLSIDAGETEFDDLLRVYSAAAVDQVERYCELALGPKEGRVWKAEALPSRLVLPGPNVSVTGFSYLDGDGEAVTGDASSLRILAGGEVSPKPGQYWPGDVAGGIVITFSAGYAAGEVPPALKQAALLFVGHLFANREAVQASGSIGGEIPLGFRMLCSPFRAVVV